MSTQSVASPGFGGPTFAGRAFGAGSSPPSGHGVIPSPAAVQAAPLDLADVAERGVFAFNSRDIRSRAFNLLRAQVLKIARASGWRIIGVTSATPGVGKSFVASNLAAALSRSPELQTYLFDLDLRRSSLAEIFGLEGNAGIARFLDGSLDGLASVARRVGEERLTVVPSYPERTGSAELLSGERFEALVAAMRAMPGDNIVLCDLPPVFANDDTVVAMQRLDAYLLVVEEGVTTKKQLRDVERLLAPAPCLGTVLNRYQGGLMADDYGYGYGYAGQYEKYYG